MHARLLPLAAATAAVLAVVASAAGAGRDAPGGGRIAFALKDATGVSSIYSARPDGNGLVRLTTGPSGTLDLCADYSRDGRQLAFCSNRSGSFQIWTMQADGTGMRQVTTAAGANFTFPDFSPNGRLLVFAGTATASASNDDVYVIGADGSGVTQLTSGAGNNDYPAYSPDGRRIAFVSDRTGVEQVWVMNADGTGNRQLTSGPGNDFGAAWSPDGRQIAFVRDVGRGDRSVWVMDADGSNAHRLLPIPLTEYVPAWGPAH